MSENNKLGTLYIGIDPGVTTGYAEIYKGEYITIRQMDIIDAMEAVRINKETGFDICLHVENPNKRTYYKPGTAQGAGSIKRDYSIWVSFAAKHNIRMFPISPADIGSTFNNEAVFKAATGYQKKCGIHARDAAKIIYKFKK